MSQTSPGDVTRLLVEIGNGDADALHRLLPLVYEELKAMARRRMAREAPGQTLQPTALVHEAYLRLVGDPSLDWRSRRYFFAAAAEAMRRILIERARHYARQKHGGGRKKVNLSDVQLGSELPTTDILALEEALGRLEKKDEARSDVVKLRFFAGLTVEETAQSLGISPRSVKRLWAGARAWLHREIAAGAPT